MAVIACYQGTFGHLPVFLGPCIVLFPGFVPDRKLHLVFVEAEGLHDEEHEIEEVRNLFVDLLPGAEDVRVILCETAHSEHPVQDSALFIAVDSPELREPNREIPVAAHRGLVDLDVPGAVHRLDDKLLVLDVENVHVCAVIVVVPGGLPQRAAGDVWRGHELVPAVQQHLPEKIFYYQPHPRTLRMPEDQAGPCLLGDAEQIQLAPELPVIALPGFLELRQVRLQFIRSQEGGPIDSLQASVAFVSLPV